jgi:hypothetical protein
MSELSWASVNATHDTRLLEASNQGAFLMADKRSTMSDVRGFYIHDDGSVEFINWEPEEEGWFKALPKSDGKVGPFEPEMLKTLKRAQNDAGGIGDFADAIEAIARATAQLFEEPEP